jgi:hypothetical protein
MKKCSTWNIPYQYLSMYTGVQRKSQVRLGEEFTSPAQIRGDSRSPKLEVAICDLKKRTLHLGFCWRKLEPNLPI